VYQLRPKVTASILSVASRGWKGIVSVASWVFNPKYDELRPAVSKELYQLHRKIWMYKMSNNWKLLTQFDCTLFCTQLYAHIQNCWMISATQLLYNVTVYTLLKKSFRGRRQAHYVPNIAHFKLFLWCDGNTVSGNYFNAVSLRVPSTWQPNCAHIILIHSTESPVWFSLTYCCFMSRSYSICSPVNSFFHSWYEKRSSKYQVEQIPIMTVARTQTLNMKFIN
jgi:hypothetical protein